MGVWPTLFCSYSLMSTAVLSLSWSEAMQYPCAVRMVRQQTAPVIAWIFETFASAGALVLYAQRISWLPSGRLHCTSLMILYNQKRTQASSSGVLIIVF
jgi:hypothetical protein